MEKHNREKDKELTDVHEPEEARSKCWCLHLILCCIFKQCIALYAQLQAIIKCDPGTASGNMMVAVQTSRRKLCSNATAPGHVTFSCDPAHLQLGAGPESEPALLWTLAGDQQDFPR